LLNPFVAVCGAISALPRRWDAAHESAARFASTTLVLESEVPDFSTVACNSDLIANNEISPRPMAGGRKTKTRRKTADEVS
jgi:hypothetical protein